MKALPREDSCERSNCSILSTDSKDGATSQDSIIHSGCKGLTFCLLYRHATLSPKKKKILKLQISRSQMPNILLKPRANGRATLLANNSQHCWMFHVVSLCTTCCMLLRFVGSCCAKFETGQMFSWPTMLGVFESLCISFLFI